MICKEVPQTNYRDKIILAPLLTSLPNRRFPPSPSGPRNVTKVTCLGHTIFDGDAGAKGVRSPPYTFGVGASPASYLPTYLPTNDLPTFGGGRVQQAEFIFKAFVTQQSFYTSFTRRGGGWPRHVTLVT